MLSKYLKKKYKNFHNLDNVKNSKLKFWELHKVIEKELIEKIVTHFYFQIFEDVKEENQNFVDEFKLSGDVKHHVKRQASFWLSSFNFRDHKYIGGIKKLNKHHILVSNIMNQNGANLWMQYMHKTLLHFKRKKDINYKIYECLKDYNEFCMHLYSVRFNFKYEYSSTLSKL
jgi:truncated hemoglobin YjbI